MIKITQEGFNEFCLELHALVKKHFGTFGVVKESTSLIVGNPIPLNSNGTIYQQHFGVEFDTAYKIEEK